VADSLLIRLEFPRCAYSGADLGAAEALPAPARVQSAFLAAAAGGPFADAKGQRLVADERHRQAVRWLEMHKPLAIIAPRVEITTYAARRYRLRAAPVPFLNDTPFEPLAALDGPVIYVWPAADRDVLEGLGELALEVTHVGRAESIVIADVSQGALPDNRSRLLRRVEGRGPGEVLRVPTPGRVEALEAAHAKATGKGRYGPGSKGRQASDEPVESAGELATTLCRFTRDEALGPWPFAEAWRLSLDGRLPQWACRLDRRVAVAAAVHRAIVAAIGADVPSFVSGRDGDGPLRGAGHLAIHPLITRGQWGQSQIVLGVPDGVPEADRGALLEALERRPRLKLAGSTLRLGVPAIGYALPFWAEAGELMATSVPIVLDAVGSPRRGRWTLDDAVICSVGYAMRGVLEAEGIDFNGGWAFRQELVLQLRALGVRANARRVASGASAFVHRASPRDLLVAVHANVELGELAPAPGGLLALGRARHMGGGLLEPVRGDDS